MDRAMIPRSLDNTLLPSMRVGQVAIPDHQLTVVEISIPPRPCRAVAIVVDLSDSCPSLREEIQRLPRLVEAMPRAWPLWWYRLSEQASFQQSNNLQIGDLQDVRVKPGEFLHTEAIARAGRATGSFLSPVVEAIENRRRIGDLDGVTVLLLTDGELLDRDAVPVPPSMRIIGLAPVIEADKVRHWHRVLSGQPFYTLADRALDDALGADSYPFHGASQVAWQFEGRTIEAYCLHSCPAVARRLESSSIVWNFLDGPLYLAFEASPQDFRRLRVACTSQQNDTVVNLSAVGRLRSLEPSLPAAIERAVLKQTYEEDQVVLDTAGDCEGFPLVWKAVRGASGLAGRRAKWVDCDGRLIAFTDPCFKNRLFEGPRQPKWDAFLCLYRGDIAMDPARDSRVVVVALQRLRQPALRWQPGVPLSFGGALCQVEIEYVEEEKCWQIKYGDEAFTDLELNGSQILTQRLLADSAGEWTALFSGDLRSQQARLR